MQAQALSCDIIDDRHQEEHKILWRQVRLREQLHSLGKMIFVEKKLYFHINYIFISNKSPVNPCQDVSWSGQFRFSLNDDNYLSWSQMIILSETFLCDGDMEINEDQSVFQGKCQKFIEQSKHNLLWRQEPMLISEAYYSKCVLVHPPLYSPW